ncbi:MAG: serine hydrolase domain-containing protein [Acidimicrobiales bacterium]
MSSDRLARIDPVMEAFAESGGFAGLSVVLARRGQTVFSGQYGFRDREAGLPMTGDTIFRIYSMTKPVVSTALMMLFEEGRFRLTDPVAKYLPAFGAVKVLQEDGSLVEPLRPMQVRDLLTHTSGLTYDFLQDFAVADRYREARLMNDPTRTLGQVITDLAALPLAFQPGSRWHYSVGIDVAAHLIEVIADEPLGAFLQRRMFGPLGMVDTAFGVPADQLGRLSAMYGLPDLFARNQTFGALFEAWSGGYNQRADVSDTYPTDAPDTFVRGGIGLYATIGDYLRFGQMLAAGGQLDGTRLLGRKTLAFMHSNHLPADLLPYTVGGVPNPGWGFGLGSRVMMDPAATGAPGSVGEFGWAGAAKTYYWVDPVEDLVGVLMTQYMVAFDQPEMDLRALTYQAIID